jgi:hypothetical protein
VRCQQCRWHTLALPGRLARVGIVNRRNALLGWAVVKLAKRLLKRKVKAAASGARARPLKTGAVGIASAAAVGGVLWFLRRRDGAGGDTPGE